MKTILLKNVYWYVDKINNIIIPISYNQDRTFVKNLLDDKSMVINRTDLSYRRDVAKTLSKNYENFKVSSDFDVYNSSYFFVRNIDCLPMMVRIQYKKCDSIIEQSDFIENFVKNNEVDSKFLKKVCKKFKSNNKVIRNDIGRE